MFPGGAAPETITEERAFETFREQTPAQMLGNQIREWWCVFHPALVQFKRI